MRLRVNPLAEIEFVHSIFGRGTNIVELALLIAGLFIVGALIPPRHELLFWR